MTATETLVNEFLRSASSANFREVFAVLDSFGLQPLGKSNTDTLLYQYRCDGDVYDIFAFRLGPPRVISFPKSYWLPRAAEMSRHLENFSYSERPPTEPGISTSQYSAGQIELQRSTRERVRLMCVSICEGLSAGTQQ